MEKDLPRSKSEQEKPTYPAGASRAILGETGGGATISMLRSKTTPWPAPWKVEKALRFKCSIGWRCGRRTGCVEILEDYDPKKDLSSFEFPTMELLRSTIPQPAVDEGTGRKQGQDHPYPAQLRNRDHLDKSDGRPHDHTL